MSWWVINFAGFCGVAQWKSAVSFGKSFLWLLLVWALAPFLSGLLFFLDETQIWLGDLRVVVVGVPVCFLVYLICLPLWTLLVLVQMSFRLLMLM